MERLAKNRRIVSALLMLLAWSCGSKHDKGHSGSGQDASGQPITSPLKYYNHFPFNNVYTLPVTVGGQSVETVLDTGSSNLLVLGDAAHCPGCVNEYGYDSTYAPTAAGSELATGWSMNFAPIGQATVKGHADTVAFGGLSLGDFAFGMVTAEKGIPNIWGIAYKVLAKPSGASQTPLFDAMVAAGQLANQFSLTLCATASGSSVTLGGYEPLVDMSKVQWTPITQKVWYTVKVARISASPNGSTAEPWDWQPTSAESFIVDSGTNPLVLPAAEVESLAALLASVAKDAGLAIPAAFWPTAAGAGGFTTLSDADVAKFPPLVFEVADAAAPGETFTLSVSPATYFQKRADGQRFLGIQPGPSPQYILGTVFMENFVVLHARGALDDDRAADPTAQLGFYPVTGFCAK